MVFSVDLLLNFMSHCDVVWCSDHLVNSSLFWWMAAGSGVGRNLLLLQCSSSDPCKYIKILL